MRFLSETSMSVAAMKAFIKKAVEELATNPYPDYIKRDYFCRLDGEGLTFYILYDIEKGREEEGIKDIHDRMLKFSDAIEFMSGTGLTPLLTVQELYASLCVEPPAELNTDG